MAKRKPDKRSQSVDSHSGSDDQDVSGAKKQKEETITKATISDVEFKFLLRDPTTVSEGLEKFVQSVEALSDGVPCDDILAGYCRSSPACSELFDLLDPAIGQLKMNDITLAFQCLEQILTRIRTDLLKCSSTGEAIVQRILAAHMGQLYTCLRDQNKSRTIKIALQLLIAMTMQSEKAKRAVLSRLNFGHQNFPALFRRRNRKDPQDVRSCLVLLTMAFLLDSDNNIVNTLVQQKTFLQMTIAGLKFDSKETVVDVLSTLLDKVVKCPGLTKTSKIKLFSENVLKQLCELYNWLGPTEWKAGGKKWKDKGEEEIQIPNEALIDDQEEIADIAHKFLLELCCSHKYGINFHDRTLGTGTRYQNQLLGHLLQWLVKKMDESHTAELIIAILCACPDQIKPIVTGLCPLLVPRWSDKWAELMNWLTKLYNKLPEIPAFLENSESQKEDEIATLSMATIFCLPPPKIAATITQGLKHDDLRVRHRCLVLLQVLARKASAVQEIFIKRGTAGLKLADGIGRESLIAYIMKSLPPMSHLIVGVDKVMLRLSVRDQKGKESKMTTEVKGELDSDLSAHVVLLLQVLTLYQKLCPALLSERPKDLAKLIDMVGKLQTGISDEEIDKEGEYEDNDRDGEDDKWLPQLYLMKLLSEADARKISLGREGLLEKLLLSANQSGRYKDLTISLVCKMLQGVNVFAGHERELEIWLNAALNGLPKSCKDRDTSISSTQADISFLSHCLCSLINNPTPYLDRLMESLADMAASTHPDHLDTETSSVGTNESAINAILLMEDEELDSLLEASKSLPSSSKLHSPHLPFSPLVLTALDGLHYCKTDKVRIQKFVSRVLVDLLHTLPSQSSLAFMVKKSEAKLCEGVGAYLESWISHRHQRKDGQLTSLPSDVCGSFTSQLSALYLGNSETEPMSSLDLVTQKIKGMETREWQPGIGQVLLYMAESARKAGHKPESKKLMDLLTQIAQSLIDYFVLEGDLENKKMKSSNKETKQLSIKEEDTETFSDFLSDIGTTRNKIAEAVRFTLLNTNILSLLAPSPHPLFDKKKKKLSPKETRKKEPSEDILCQISEFVCYALEKCKKFPWIQEDKKIKEKHLEIALDKLSATNTLSFRHEQVYIQIVNTLCPWLDLINLSTCIAKLLQFPYSKLIANASDIVKHGTEKFEDSDNENKTTLICETLISLLNQWTLMVADRALKSSFFEVADISDANKIPTNYDKDFSDLTKQRFEGKQVQFTNCSIINADGVHTKGCVKIQTSFRLEEHTKLKPSDFSPFFNLLVNCSLIHLELCAISLLTYVPGMIAACGESLQDKLFFAPIKIQSSSRQHIAVILVQNQKESFNKAQSWLEKHMQKAVKKEMWWLIRSYLQARMKFGSESKKTVIALKKLLPSMMNKILEGGGENELTCLKLLSLAIGTDDCSFQQLVTDSVSDFLKKLKDVQTLHYEILLVSSKFDQHPKTNKKDGKSRKPECVIMNLVQGHLGQLAAKKKRDEKMETFLLDLALSLAERCSSSHFQNLETPWISFVKNTLRHLYTSAKLLRLLTYLVPAVYPLTFPQDDPSASSADGVTYLSAKTMFQLCVSHTAFMEVMMTPGHTLAKDELVKLLQSLGEVDASCYQPQLSKVFIGAYGATLSKTDQMLLLMIEKCSPDTDENFECPSLWGKSALDHYTVSQVLGPSLDKQASVKAILEQLDPVRLQDSILNFPVRRGQKTDQISDASDFKSKPDCYDPSFLLRFFGQVLLPDKLVPLRLFVEHGCLSYLLVALSSHDLKSRLLAYQALNDFYTHAEGSRWQERLELNFVLDLLNASRVKDGQKLPFVVALFFARVVKLILYPADPLYMPIFRFLVARPEMDLANVPEFYQLFFSSGLQHKQERNWMLSLLRDGLRESSDYWLYQRRLIFKIVLAFYDSALSDNQSQVLVLQIVRSGCEEKTVAVDLVKNHGLLSWLSSVVSGLAKRPNHVDLVCDIIHSLWSSLTTSKYQNLSKRPTAISKNDNTAEGADFVTDMDVSEKMMETQNEEDDTDDEENTSEDESRMDQSQRKNSSYSGDTTDAVLKKKSPSVPKSTLVEMSLMVKSLIWHLSKATITSLDKILQVFHSMLQPAEYPDAQKLCKSESNTIMGTSSRPPPTGQDSDQVTVTQQNLNLLSLSPIESCLLLYQVAKSTRQEITAKHAQDMLMSRGVNVEWLSRTHKGKYESVREATMARADHSEVDETLTREVTEMDEMEGEGDKGEKEDEDGVLHSVDEKEGEKVEEKEVASVTRRRYLFDSLCSVVRLTGTLEFV